MNSFLKTAYSLILITLTISSNAQWQALRSIDVDKFEKLPISNKLQYEGNAGAVLFDESGQKLMVGIDGKLIAYDVFSMEELWTIESDKLEPNSAVNLFGLTLDLFAVANNVASGGMVYVYSWEGKNFNYVSPYGTGRRGLTYAYPGILAWAAFDGSVLGADLIASKLITPGSGLKGHTRFDVSLKYDPDGQLYSVSPDKQFIKWEKAEDNTMAGGKTVLFNAENPLMSLDVSPYIAQQSYPNLAAIGENRGMVRIIDLADGVIDRVKSKFTVSDGYAGNLYFHMSDPNLLIIGGKQSIVFYDFKTNSVRKTINLPAEIRNLAQSADGTKLAVSLRDGTIQVYSLGRSLVDLRVGDKAKVLSIDLNGGASSQLYKFAGINVGGEVTYLGQEVEDEKLKYKFKASLSSGMTMTSGIEFKEAVRVLVEKVN